ncbi:MAG: hypothetical protein BJG00_007580 [Limnothrix sp. CACIAM 69d]|nr:MAG: hypothetical protein BJG00_007580 [Limnothrix sp. CACIAM 69d]
MRIIHPDQGFSFIVCLNIFKSVNYAQKSQFFEIIVNFGLFLAISAKQVLRKSIFLRQEFRKSL